MQLRPYQQKTRDDVYEAWDAGARNTLTVLPTGAGKTVLFSDIIRNNRGPSVAIAHRQELVSQISLALARNDVPHRIIGPSGIARHCVNLHMQEVGRSLISPNSPCAVAGVDTLIRRDTEHWSQSVTLWVQDEAHHLLRDNKWGKAIAMFPNARGLGVTATPERADGKGLGLHADGVFNTMIVGPSMRDLINMQYLTDYRIFCPPSDLDVSSVPITANGDFSPQPLRLAVKKSHIMGDVVDHYIRKARGKLGVTFATDVDTAQDIADKFNALGIPAAMVCANTPDADRVKCIRRFKNRELLQLVNVDLFGEGFDLPAIEVVSMARPTESYPLYVQQFGRGLRIMDGKTHAIIIDHVGNVFRHGLPDAPRNWSMSGREKRGSSKAGEIYRSCPSCTAVYERELVCCPFCGFKPVPVIRSGPEYVDGDLNELDSETLARLRGAVARVNMTEAEARADLQSRNVPHIGVLAGVKRHRERKEAQGNLYEAIAWWSYYQGADGSAGYKKFYSKFGIDVLSAQALNAQDADILTLRIWEALNG